MGLRREKNVERKKMGCGVIVLGFLIIGLIIGPWIWIGILLNKEPVSVDGIDRSIDLTCTDVTYDSCTDTVSCLDAAKQIMDVCQAIDTHNDLPYTFLKYQNGSALTAIGESFGIDLDLPSNDLYGVEILDKESPDSHTNIPLMQEGRLFGQFWSIYISCNTNFKDAVDWGLQQIDITMEFIKKYPEFEFSSDPWRTKKLMNEGIIASMMGMEGGHMIGSRLSILRQMYNLGVRYLTLTHNCNTAWVDSNNVDSQPELARNGGLSEFGKDVIREMNRIGMLVDLSHVSTSSMLDALEVSEAPVIFSHSGARAIAGHARNVPDEVLLKVKDNKGVVCIVFYSAFVSDVYNSTDPSTVPLISDLADHFDYVKQLIGAEHLCMGADYNGVGSVPIGMENVSTYPNLIAELLKRGWSQDEVQGVLQENLLRAWKDADEVAQRLQEVSSRGNGRFIPDEDFNEVETDCKQLYTFALEPPH